MIGCLLLFPAAVSNFCCFVSLFVPSSLTGSQLFQCFIDERFEAGANQENLEVLFFDECIEEEAGRQTPFLSDTSQAHQPKNRMLVPAPNTEGLDADQGYVKVNLFSFIFVFVLFLSMCVPASTSSITSSLGWV